MQRKNTRGETKEKNAFVWFSVKISTTKLSHAGTTTSKGGTEALSSN